jgi:parvulin-like peptidyl-prolyl isomerase
LNKDIAIALIAVVAVAGLTFALDSAIAEKPLTPSQPFEAKAAAVGVAGIAAEPKDDSPVVMRVNGEPVTEKEFNRFIEQAPAEQQAMLASPQGRQMVAQELVKVKALEQEGRKLGLDQSPDVRNQVGMIEAQLVAAKAVEKLVGTPTEQELRAAFEKERPNMETVELSHILVAYQGGQVPPRSGQPLTVEQAMQKANAIAERLRGGADFAQMAAAVSDETNSAQQGGSLGAVPLTALPADMAPAVANLRTGQVSGPVRSGFGIHIFKAGKRESRKFEELRPMLEQRLKQERAQGVVTRTVAAAKVDRDPKFFGAPAAQPQVPQPGGKMPS